MAARRETVVVGGGAMGSATAWHLARRGRQVTLLERFGARHTMGASHGRSRNFNITYADATYQAMLREAAVLWRELEDESGAMLLDLVGVTNHGAGIAPDLAEALGALGVRASMLTPAEAQERWAGIRFDTRVLYCSEGGRLDVAFQEIHRHRGEKQHHQEYHQHAQQRPGFLHQHPAQLPQSRNSRDHLEHPEDAQQPRRFGIRAKHEGERYRRGRGGVHQAAAG